MAQVQTAIQGTCDQKFELVRKELERNFAERGELGASVAITLDGKTVVDLWGGTADAESGRPWDKDTKVVVWSSTKGATALCAHILADRGELDFDAPVAKYWPEFGNNGKETIPVRMLLNHQAGIAALREPLPVGAFLDWERMTSALATETPWWEPGTRHGYHAFTFGWLVGEVVKRISGQSLGAFFADQVAKRHDIDFWIGLPEDLEPTVAPDIPPAPPAPGEPVSPVFVVAMTQPESLQAKQIMNTGGYFPDPTQFDSRAGHAAEIPAVGGITNGRGLAAMYALLAGGTKNTVVSEKQIARMAAVSSASGSDASLLLPTRFSLGYVKSIDNRRISPSPDDSILMSEDAFGHPGVGGSVGFADPRAGMSFGYAMNRMGAGAGLNARGQSLVDAAYRSLGYSSNASGAWIREG
jgi:CubicO group peptidase (beta-lactamase class C family)